MAGLVCYYNGTKFHYLYISHDERVGKHLRVMSSVPDSTQTDAFTPPIAIPVASRCTCVSRWITSDSTSPIAWKVSIVNGSWLPQQFDASILSDEATAPGLPNFTGAFVGMSCQDMAGTLIPADFDFFEYRERGFRENPFCPALSD